MWVFSLRMINRVLGLVRTIVLARLLAPEDFGLLGIAMLSVSTVETFSQTGFQAAIVQKKENVASYLDTAWTASALRGLILFLLLFLFAPFIAKFFNSPQATLVIKVIAISILFDGFSNIGIILFQKDLDFKRQFYFEFTATVVNLSVSISLAIILRNIWALVAGGIAANLVRLVMSYIIHPYRPKIAINQDKLKEMFVFGRWIFISSIILFLCTHGDDIYVGKLFGIAALGIYQMAYNLSNLATTEISHLISRVTFPAYSKLQNEIPRLREAFLRVLKITAFFAFPISGCILLFSSEFTRIFLGEKWLEIVPILNILVIAAAFRSIAATTGPVIRGVGNPKIDTFWQITRLIFLAAFIYPFSAFWGIKGPAIAVLISILAPTFGLLVDVKKIIMCNHIKFLNTILLPMLNTIIMVLIILLIKKLYLTIFIIDFFILIISSLLLYIAVAVIFEFSLNYGLRRIIRENLKLL